MIRGAVLLVALFAAGCTCGPEADPTPAPTPDPTPAPAAGWRHLGLAPDHGAPPDVAFERGADAGWVVTPDGRAVRRFTFDGEVGDRVPIGQDARVASVIADGVGPAAEVALLDVASRSLVRLAWSPSTPPRLTSEPLSSARPLGSLDRGAAGPEVLDAAQRPLAEGTHPALRGVALPGGRRVRAGVSKGGPTLFVTGPDGTPLRRILSAMPKAEKVEVVGVDAEGRPWLLAETGPAGGRRKHLVRVDLQGRLLEQAAPPDLDDTVGPVGPGKGSGRFAADVDAAGRVLWAAASERGVELHLYTPGVPGSGPLRVETGTR